MILVSIGARAVTLCVLATLLTGAGIGAQQPTFTPDHPDGIYKAGERIGWTVTLPKGAKASGPYSYVIRRFGADSIGAGTLTLVKGRGRIETSLAQPAMVVVEV